ncbi:MAG TPA: ATP-binding protein [Burkholderiaceae bacterium]|jgi:signal transduction histidine kinase/CheY-like chemotaxis protein
MRIRSQLLLVAAVVFIPGFIASVIAVEKVRDGEREAALRGLGETVRATALLVDGQVQRSLGALTALAQSDYLRTGDFAAFYTQAQASNQPPNVWTLLLDENGRQILNTAVPFGTPPPSPPSAETRERVAHALSSPKLYVSDLIVGPVTGKVITTMYLATKDWSGKRYVVAQAFALDHWKDSVLLPSNRPAWLVGVLDRKGRFIARNHGSEERVGQPARPELVAAAAADQSGLIRHATLEGMESYDAFTHSALTGWTVAVAAPVSSIEASATQAVTLLAAGGALALIAAILAALYWGRTFIEVIALASRAARRVGQGEEPKLKPTSIHEVNTLYDALADAGHLLAAEKNARAIAETQRTLLLEQETALREAAQRQNAAKDQFLALLGHELRNPLAAISGATAVLRRGRVVSEGGERFLQIIERQNHHLRHIVDDLLEVSRMLSGKLMLELTALDLAACVRSCVEAIQGTERAHLHQLVVEAAQPVWVRGDAVRIEQIVNNLVSNALKFSNPGTPIRIGVKAVGEQAVLEVRDEGLGISPELMPRIFDPFVQGPAQPGKLATGLGVGLSLVKQLVELHGGTVNVRSQGADTGSSFTITLPRIMPAATLARVPSQAPENRRHILFVEDNEDAMASMSEVLRMMGHEVVPARNAAEALAQAEATAQADAGFDVVLMDIGLPDKTGYELAGALRKLPATAHARMVALTGYGQASDKERALSAGFDMHLSKPADPDQLARIIG